MFTDKITDGRFSCRQTRVLEPLVSDITTQFNHGDENMRIKSRSWGRYIPTLYDDFGKNLHCKNQSSQIHL